MEFSTGSVLSRSLSVLFKNLIAFLVIGVVVFIPVFVVAVVMTSGAQTEKSVRMASLVITLISMVASYVAAAAIAYGVFKDLSGHRASVGDCLAVGFGRLFPVLGVALLAGLAVAGGTILLIVPGIIIACMLYVAVPVAVVERPGVFASLSRSAELTKGNRWAVFAIVLVIGVLAYLANLVLGGIIESTDAVVLILFSTVVSLLFNVWGAVAQAVTYHDLRKAKEGTDISELVDVFA